MKELAAIGLGGIKFEKPVGGGLITDVFDKKDMSDSDLKRAMEMSVLKPKHSLVGKSLVPVILKFKAQVERIEECDLNRLKKGHALTRYNLDELRAEFEGLTGESSRDILLLTGREEDFDSLVILMHFAIEQANMAGAPKGQVLVQTSSAEVNQGAASSVQNSGAVASSCSAATASTTCSSSVSTASVSQASGTILV
uniref:Uncharacterized protein n=1 Tax=Magallana gigas TaxID=29159 RepID=K1Q110_MAGGI